MIKHMKNLISIVLLMLALPQIGAQLVQFTAQNFRTEIYNYEPVQREGVSDENFNKGRYILEDVKKATKNDPNELNCADYWNITVAFIKLQEPKAHIELAFQHAIEADAETICEYLDVMGEGQIPELIPEVFQPFRANCKGEVEKPPFDARAYAEKYQLDFDLVSLMYQVGEDDQLYRDKTPVEWSKQTPIDDRNTEIMDSLLTVYGGYVGESLVGPELSYFMWIVIQHSTLEKMAAYVPQVHKAYLEKEVPAGPFKMLLDRVYCTRDGYQIFGRQMGDCEDATDEQRKAVMERYDL